MLNFAVKCEDKVTAERVSNAMCELLAGVGAFRDNTVLVPAPEEWDGVWVSMLSIGTSDENNNIKWVVTTFEDIYEHDHEF